MDTIGPCYGSWTALAQVKSQGTAGEALREMPISCLHASFKLGSNSLGALTTNYLALHDIVVEELLESLRFDQRDRFADLLIDCYGKIRDDFFKYPIGE